MEEREVWIYKQNYYMEKFWEKSENGNKNQVMDSERNK